MTARHLAAGVWVGVAAVVLTASCTSTPTAAPFSCASARETAPSVVLVDLDSNGKVAQDAVIAAARPGLRDALCWGRRLAVVLDGGDGTRLATVAGLDGTRSLRLERRNPTRASKDRATEFASFERRIRREVSAARVSGSGTATRLLASVGRSGAPAAVTVVSNLLGHGEHDCLNLDDVIHTPGSATALARRCFSDHVFSPLPAGWLLTIDVPGSTALTADQSSLAAQLANALCGFFGNQSCTVTEGSPR